MKTFVTLILILFVATSSFAAEISEADVMAFFADWLAAQNDGSYSAYAEMYSNNFSGIRRSGKTTLKLNHDAWLKDRKKMFNKKMAVQGINPKVQALGNTTLIKFEQIWESGSYKDKGEKVLTLVIESKNLKILREELVFSIVEKVNNKDTSVYISKFTSILSGKCKKLPGHLNSSLGKKGLYGDECTAPSGWHLFVIVGGDRSWIDVGHNNLIWTTEQEVVYKEENSFGYFPNITSNEVEWRINKDNIPISLIFPVTAQDPEQIGKTIKRYFIVNLNGNPRFCGTAKTDKEARSIADTATTCLSDLPKRDFMQ